ncbi:ppGpp synthetase/RelA/SpoT-type nucleotidyltransferase [Arthrobacter sp. CAN_A6]|uniref:hypothetical protein n=1 Tax=Arthrobacter sp. CAN_A6 TaxID=2787721 RepID=UPI0018CBCD98
MMVPDSIMAAYDSSLVVVEPLAELVGIRLRAVCLEENWLFSDRIKSPESCTSKLESGSASLSQLHDLYACTVVVPTRNELGKAIGRMLEIFEGELKLRSSDSAESFTYDDVHVIARLGNRVSPVVVQNRKVLERRFEIQIRTAVQYAWWRATHDAMYKSSEESAHGWKIRRAAGQVRASLELLDGLMSNLPDATEFQRDSNAPEVQLMRAKDLLRFWRPSARPADQYRFCITVNSLLSACEVDVSAVESSLRSQAMSVYLEDSGLTPLQVVVIALHRMLGDELGRRFQQANVRILVTPEFSSAYANIIDLDAGSIGTA